MHVRTSVFVALSLAGLAIVPAAPTWAGTPDADGSFPKTGLVFWVSADQAEVGTGAAVKSMRDRSGNDNPAVHIVGDDATQPILAKDPVSGLPVLSFSGVKTGLTFTRVSNIRTAFVVLSKDAAGFGAGGEQTALGDSQYNDFHVGYKPDTIINTVVADNHTSPLVAGGKIYLNGAVVDGQKTLFPKTLSVISYVTTGDCRANQIGKDRNMARSWIGLIAEMLLYSAPLTDADRTAVETYLIGKYGLDGKPPVKLDGGSAGTDASPVVDAGGSADTGMASGSGGSGIGGSTGAGGTAGSTTTSANKDAAASGTGGGAGRGAGGSSGQPTPATGDSSGCSCNLGSSHTPALPTLCLAPVAVLALFVRRRRRN